MVAVGTVLGIQGYVYDMTREMYLPVLDYESDE